MPPGVWLREYSKGKENVCWRPMLRYSCNSREKEQEL